MFEKALAEIGRIISSSLDIDEVYTRFATQVRGLIPFDGIAINLIDTESRTLTTAYAIGVPVPGRSQGDTYSVDGTITEEVVREQRTVTLTIKNKGELSGRYPRSLPLIQVGYRTFLMIPLIFKDEAIGSLSLTSFKSNAYTEQDIVLGERVASQISGAIANAQLYPERRKMEVVLTQQATTIDSSLEGIAICDENGDFLHVNDSLATIQGYDSPEELVGKPWTVLYGEDEIKRFEQEILPEFQRVGQWRGEVVGKRKDASIVHEEIAIKSLDGGGLVCIDRDITERPEAEDALRRSEEEARQLAEEREVLAEIGRIISSSLEIDGVYQHFAEHMSRMIRFDRVAITVFEPEDDAIYHAYVVGREVPGWGEGARQRLSGTSAEEVIQTRSGLLIEDASEEDVSKRFSPLAPSVDAGLRSLIATPLISHD